MNTGLSTFNFRTPTYTVFGNTVAKSESGVAAVVLNSGGHYLRGSCFAELKKCGFSPIISLEDPGNHYEIEDLSLNYPFVRFIMLQEPATIGQKINISALELDTPLFFVTWNYFHPIIGVSAEKLAERLMYSPEEFAKIPKNTATSICKRLCTIPIIQNDNFETLPTAFAPVISGKKFDVLPFAAGREGEASLYPQDACGIYDRQRFLEVGGFDCAINSGYWQAFDFGFRSWLWGHEIRASQFLRLRCDNSKPPEDTTINKDYWRFYLKNLAPILQNSPDGNGVAAHLPWRGFLPYLFKTGFNPQDALHDFSRVRKWVKDNAALFLYDARSIENFWKL